MKFKQINLGNIKYLHSNYTINEVIGPLESYWEAENLDNRVVADIGSGLGAVVLGLSKEPRVKTAIGVDVNLNSLYFAKFVAEKYGNNPEVLSCLNGNVNGKYSADNMGYDGYNNIPFVGWRFGTLTYHVPIGSLVRCIEYLNKNEPTSEISEKIKYIMSDGHNYPIKNNSIDDVICIDSAHWQTYNKKSGEKISLNDDPMLKSILRIIKPGGIIHIHSSEYEVNGSKKRAHDHLKSIADSQDISLECLGYTFEEYENQCGHPKGYVPSRAELLKVVSKPN